MKKKTIVSRIGMLAVIMALSMTAVTGCKSGDRTSDEVSSEENADTAGMVHLNSADEVSAFFDEVYGGVAEDLLPMGGAMTNELDLGDADMLSYHTGLTDLDGIEGVYLSESMISSTAYSAVYIRTTDDADAESIRKQLMDNINPAKWVCVSAEQQYAVILGNDIFFVMGHQDTASEVLAKAIAAAESRDMKVSDTLEKANPV